MIVPNPEGVASNQFHRARQTHNRVPLEPRTGAKKVKTTR